MKKMLHEELVKSIEQAGQIRKGLLKPSRVFNYRPAEVKRRMRDAGSETTCWQCPLEGEGTESSRPILLRTPTRNPFHIP